ncbi:DUF6175 family protein [Fibrobacter sp. UBA4309]|uniref:DUF6175 family protein n=1 Tax=Fibrobacter sp. UBA4309 TaxID=1946537 RepID=UPI0025BB0EC4|nr:DUF6175 family protein [Fibrobacter sp. UBA4309]
MKKSMMVAVSTLFFVGCASNPPVDNEPARARAHAAYDAADEEFGERTPAPATAKKQEEGPAVIAVSNAAFKSRPTVLVAPAMGKGETPNIEVIRKNPLAKTAMEVINAYLTSRDYSVIGLESQAQLDEVVQLQSDIAGNDEDLAYVAGLSVGADINITFAGSIQLEDLVIDLNATEASTANLLASESVRFKNEGESQRAWVQKAVQTAIVKLENKVRDRLAKDLEKGVQYKVVAHLTGEFSDEQAENISSMVSSQIRKKFNKMQVISMSRNTYDLLVYADPDVYDDAQMVYDVFVEGLNGLAKVRKQNITKKLIILEIQ